MNDYSINCQKKLRKTFDIYLNSLSRKEEFIACYDRHKEYFAEGKTFPFTFDDFYMSFRAKNFFKDLEDCGSWLEFRWYKKSDVTKLHTANFCKRDKLCPACAVRRAYKQQVKFMKILQLNPSLQNKDWYFVVIPVKHCNSDNYETVFERLNDIRKKIIQSLNDGRKGKSENIWTSFGGGMYSIETTKSKNGWNVHMNLLLNAPKGSKINLRAVKNRRGQVSYQNPFIREFLMKYADSQMHNISKVEDNTKLRDDLVEVLKYSLKFSSLSNQDLLEVFIKTRKKRLFGVFGNMYGCGIDDVEFDGDDIVDDEFFELIFNRTDFGYKLQKETLKAVT